MCEFHTYKFDFYCFLQNQSFNLQEEHKFYSFWNF
jgi:hypothetical protein